MTKERQLLPCLLASLLAGCGDMWIRGPKLYDWDGDGHEDRYDCAPEDADVWEIDHDGDGWGDLRCLYDVSATSTDVHPRCDCDDEDDQVHPFGEPRDVSDAAGCDFPSETVEAALVACAADGTPPEWAKDGIDNDCTPGNDTIPDIDGDHYGSPEGDPADEDCDDCDPEVHPGEPAERSLDALGCPDPARVYDDEDEDCDGEVVRDFDEDGFDGGGWGDQDGDGADDCAALYSFGSLGDDCDDLDPAVSPAAIELCDSIDWDCDGDPISSANPDYDFEVDPVEDLLFLDVSPGSAGGNGSAGHPFGEISEALDALPACTSALKGLGLATRVVVRLGPGSYAGSNLTFDFEEQDDLSVIQISGSGATTSLDSDLTRFLRVHLAEDQTFRLTDVGVRGGSVGGGLYVTGGSVEVSDVTFEDLYATRGAAVFTLESLSVTMEGIEARGCIAENEGGALSIEAVDVSISDSVFGPECGEDVTETCTSEEGNYAYQGGAVAVMDAETVEVTGTTFQQNCANQEGGAIYLESAAGSATFTDTGATCNASSNSSGGALWSSMNVVLDGTSAAPVTFSRNESGYSGGAVAVDGGDLDAHYCTFEENVSEYDGGALALVDAEAVDLTSLSATGNVAKHQGGAVSIISVSSVSISDSSVDSNTSEYGGGGGYFEGVDDLEFADTSIESNSSGVRCIGVDFCGASGSCEGGGVYAVSVKETANFENVTFRGNSSTGSWCGGGGLGVYSSKWVRLNSCTFTDNSSEGNGGGAYFYDVHGVQSGSPREFPVVPSTFSNNSTDSSGGALFAWDTDVYLANVLVDSNSACSDAGLAVNGGGLTVKGAKMSNNSSTCGDSYDGSCIWTYLTDVELSYVRCDGNHGGFVFYYSLLDLNHVIVNGTVPDGEDRESTLQGNTGTITNATFFDSQAATGTRIAHSSLDINNSIFADNDGRAVQGGGDADIDIWCSLFYSNGDNVEGASTDSVSLTDVLYDVAPDFEDASADGDPSNDTSFEVTNSAVAAGLPCLDAGDQVGAMGGSAEWDIYFPFDY